MAIANGRAVGCRPIRIYNSMSRGYEYSPASLIGSSIMVQDGGESRGWSHACVRAARPHSFVVAHSGSSCSPLDPSLCDRITQMFV